MNDQWEAETTISLPKSLSDYVDRLAGEWGTTRSGVIAKLLQREEEMRVGALMAEGYREMGDENRQEAEEALNLICEVVLRNECVNADTGSRASE